MDLIFDLDGTLVDSRPGVLMSLGYAVKQVFPDRDLQGLTFRIGPQIRDIMQMALGMVTEAEMSELEANFRVSYDTEGWKNTQVYPGVIQTLSRLLQHPRKLFIATNKPNLPTSRLLMHTGLNAYFHDVLTPDSRQPKFPNKADMLDFLIEKYSIAPDQVCYIGDSQEDLMSARMCGINFIGVEYGYGTFQPLDEIPFPGIKSFSEILPLV